MINQTLQGIDHEMYRETAHKTFSEWAESHGINIHDTKNFGLIYCAYVAGYKAANTCPRAEYLGDLK